MYAATKAAVESLTRIAANEFRGRSITVNAIAPGPTATELFLKDKSEAQIAKLANMAPMERLRTPEDIASIMAFLWAMGQWQGPASQRWSCVNGAKPSSVTSWVWFKVSGR